MYLQQPASCQILSETSAWTEQLQEASGASCIVSDLHHLLLAVGLLHHPQELDLQVLQVAVLLPVPLAHPSHLSY